MSTLFHFSEPTLLMKLFRKCWSFRITLFTSCFIC